MVLMMVGWETGTKLLDKFLGVPSDKELLKKEMEAKLLAPRLQEQTMKQLRSYLEEQNLDLEMKTLMLNRIGSQKEMAQDSYRPAEMAMMAGSSIQTSPMATSVQYQTPLDPRFPVSALFSM
jgi:hypothetical protein